MNHKKRNLAILICLAVLCLASAELVACRRFDPKLYQQITAPVRRGCQQVSSFCWQTMSYIADTCGDLWEDLTTPDEPPPVSQLAGEPALASGTPISDPSVTELLELNGQQVLTGGTFKLTYFNQTDDAWAAKPYGSDRIDRYGCGPSALAMAVTSMTEEPSDPIQMAQWAVRQGHWAKKSGSYLSIVNGAATAFGLPCESLECTPDAMREALLSGKLLVALMGPGHFTKGGHFILIRAITLSGEVLVADPNSLDRSLTAWDPQLILDELSASTSDGAPLWALSPPTEPANDS